MASNVLDQLAQISATETLTETLLSQRKVRFVRGAQSGHMAYATETWESATLNAPVEDSLEKRTEEYYDAFARIKRGCWVTLWIQLATMHSQLSEATQGRPRLTVSAVTETYM